MTFIVPVPGPAELAPAGLVDSTVIPHPLFRQSIAEQQCVDTRSGLWAGQAIDLADMRPRIGEQRGDRVCGVRPVLSLRVRDHQLLVRHIDDEHGEQPRRLGVTGVFAHPMMGARALKPRLAGPVDAAGLAVDLALDLAREDVGVDECRAGVTMRGRARRWGVVDDMADQALPRQVRDRLVRGNGDGFREDGSRACSRPRARGREAARERRRPRLLTTR